MVDKSVDLTVREIRQQPYFVKGARNMGVQGHKNGLDPKKKDMMRTVCQTSYDSS
jgi:hypothetical protein